MTTADFVSHCIMYTDDDMFYIQRAVALSWIKWTQTNYNYNYNYPSLFIIFNMLYFIFLIISTSMVLPVYGYMEYKGMNEWMNMPVSLGYAG